MRYICNENDQKHDSIQYYYASRPFDYLDDKDMVVFVGRQFWVFERRQDYFEFIDKARGQDIPIVSMRGYNNPPVDCSTVDKVFNFPMKIRSRVIAGNLYQYINNHKKGKKRTPVSV